MVALYLKYCTEEEFTTPLSRRTMFRILEVCEASQRKSLRGLDNIAADGVMGFDTIERIYLHKLRVQANFVSSLIFFYM